MRRVLNIGLPSHRERQNDRMKGEDVEERVKAILIELQETHQHERAGQHVGDIEGETAHLEAP